MSSDSDPASQLKRLLDARLAEVVGFRHALTEETNRGCALLAASYLDAEIEQLLLQTMVDDPQVAQDIIGSSGPLGSFSARIDLAYLIGLVGPTVHRDLHLIRKIRNEFGHSARPITFEEPSVASRCQEFRLTYLDLDARPRWRFTSTVLGVTAHLHVARFRTKHLSPAEEKASVGWTQAEVEALAKQLLEKLIKDESDA